MANIGGIDFTDNELALLKDLTSNKNKSTAEALQIIKGLRERRVQQTTTKEAEVLSPIEGFMSQTPNQMVSDIKGLPLELGASIAGDIKEKALSGLESIKEGFTGAADVIKRGAEEPFGAIPGAIKEEGVVQGLISGGKENLETALEEYIPELGMQIPKIVSGGMEAIFAIPMGVMEKVPGVEQILNVAGEKINDLSEFTVSNLIPNATGDEKENLVQSFNNLYTLGIIKATPAIEGQVVKGAKAVKEKIAPKPTVQEVVGRITQGKEADIPKAAEALSDISLEGVTTYKDLVSRTKGRIKELATKQDELLGTKSETYNSKNTEITAKAKETGEVISSNPVNEAITHLQEYYKSKPSELARLKDIESKFNAEGLTLKELNNIAREYNTTFRDKAFTKAGEPKTSVSAITAESTRAGIKDIVREKMGDPLLKEIDTHMSNLYTLDRTASKMAEKVNSLTQTIQPRTFMEKLGRAFGTPLSVVLSKLGMQEFLTKVFIKSNVGIKRMNSLSIQEALGKNLKTLESITELGKGKTMDALIDMVKENLTKQEFAKWAEEFKKSSEMKALPEGSSIQLGEASAEASLVARGEQLKSKTGLFEESPDFKRAATPQKSTGLLAEAKKYKTADEFIEAQGLKFDYEKVANEKRVIIDIFPNESIKGKGVTKSETLSAFEKAYNDGHKIIEPSNGLWTKDGFGFIKKIESDGYVKQIKNRGGIERFEITPKINKLKTKSQLTDIWEEAQKAIPEQSLLQEAKKYKSAEDFVKSQKPIYHGTAKSFKEFDPAKITEGNLGKGIYLTDNQIAAKYHSLLADRKQLVKEVDPKTLKYREEKLGEVMEVKVSSDAKIKEFSKMPTKEMVDKAKQEGFDGVKYPDELYKTAEDWNVRLLGEMKETPRTTLVFNADKIKTKSQLIDIWEKANK